MTRVYNVLRRPGERTGRRNVFIKVSPLDPRGNPALGRTLLVLLETEVPLGVLLRGWGVLSPALLNKGSIRARILGRGERFSFLAGNCFHYRARRQQKKRHLRAREPARVAPDLPFKGHWTRHRNLVLFLGMRFRGSKAHFEERKSMHS